MEYTKGDAGELVEHLAARPRLVGLTGLAGSGKDTAAEALVAAGWKRDAFADRMRVAVLALDPWVDVDPFYRAAGRDRLSFLVERYGWDEAKREYPEVRRLLQKFGTEAGRKIHGDDCWIDLLFRSWDNETSLVITDCRFNNEAEAVRARGGLVVRIDRPGLEPLPGGHASEAGVSPALVDIVVFNDGPVGKLHASMQYVASAP